MKVTLGLLLLFTLLHSCVYNNPNASLTLYNISYGNHDRQKMDVYLPAHRNTSDTKVLVWIHGGAWSSGDKSEFNNIKPILDTTLNNFAYISLNYRLFDANSGTHRFPSQENDIRLALTFIRSKLNQWLVSDRLILVGVSAGGHLALLHANKNNEDELVKACIAYFPPTELSTYYSANLLSTLVLHGVLNGTPTEQSQAYFDSSPINFITENSVPTLFFHGTADEIVPISQSELLKNKLIEHGVTHSYNFFQDEGHGFTLPKTLTSINQLKAFLLEIGL